MFMRHFFFFKMKSLMPWIMQTAVSRQRWRLGFRRTCGTRGWTMTKMPYAKVIRSLMYVAIQTRPDISFVVQHLSQYMTNLMQEHWTAVKHVLWYLKGTCNEGIVYSRAGNTQQLEIYSNANFANQTDTKSILGYSEQQNCSHVWKFWIVHLI